MFGKKKDDRFFMTTGASPYQDYVVLDIVHAGGFTVGLAKKAVEVKAKRKGADAVIDLQVSTGLGGIHATGTAVQYPWMADLYGKK